MGNGDRASCVVDPSAFIGEHLSIGLPSEESILKGREGHVDLSPVSVGPNCIIKNFVTLSEGASLAGNVVVEDYCRVGPNARIGPRSRIIYGAYICDDVKIGADCRVAGFVCDDVTIEDSCTVMGQLVHAYNQPHRGWWDVDEPAPSIRHHSVVAFSSTIIGPVTIGPYAYVVAGATITKDVPAWHVASGSNRLIPWREWSGRPLRDLFAHWESLDRGTDA